jgi:medium-chain acyl-[acyl-carrier-protein] hydrolase
MREAEFVEELRRLKGTPLEVLNDSEMMAILAPTLRADFEMIETYQYSSETPLPYPMTVYGGLEDPDVPAESLYAWGKVTSSTLNVRLLPGDHFFIHSPHFPRQLRTEIESLGLSR